MRSSNSFDALLNLDLKKRKEQEIVLTNVKIITTNVGQATWPRLNTGGIISLCVHPR